MENKNLNENLNEQELENVSGGEFRVVNTGDARPAAIRSYPGLNAPVVATLVNGTQANSTGRFTYAGFHSRLCVLMPKNTLKAS